MEVKVGGKPVRINLSDLGSVIRLWPQLAALIAACRAVTVDNDGDGKAIEFEAGEMEAILAAVGALVLATRKPAGN